LKKIARIFAVVVLVGAGLNGACFGQQSTGWPVYNSGVDGDHYSRLTQINRDNVKRLAVAWRFDTGEKGGLQANPLIVGRTLYTYTPTQKVVALDAATGELKWKFDSGIKGTQPARGMAYWTDGKRGRILVGVMNFLYCLDAEELDCADHAGSDLQGPDYCGGTQPGDASGAAGGCAGVRCADGQAAVELSYHSASGGAGVRDLAAGCVEDGGRGE
jgi:hypothetical protein